MDEENPDDPGMSLELLESSLSSGIMQEAIQPPRVASWRDWQALPEVEKEQVKANSMLRRHIVFMLLAEGKGYSELAREFKVTPAQVLYDARRMAADLNAAGVLDVELERQMAMSRLDRMTEAYFQRALDGDIEAGALLIQIENRRARLTGADRPLKMKIDHTHRKAAQVKMSNAEFEKRLFEVAHKMRRKGLLQGPMYEFYERHKERYEVVEGKVVSRETSAAPQPVADSVHSGPNPTEKVPSEQQEAQKLLNPSPSEPHVRKEALSQCFGDEPKGVH
jgi:hypothetical protein